MKNIKNADKISRISIVLLMIAAVITACIACVTAPSPGEESGNASVVPPAESSTVPAVIFGVKGNITVYEDDAYEDIYAVLLDGVYVESGDNVTVKAVVLSDDGTELTSFAAGEYSVRYYCENADADPVFSRLTVKEADTVPPDIEGAANKTVYKGGSISYREGVTVTDNDDEDVQLKIDASKVNINEIGEYEVIYSATDKRGNKTEVYITVTVLAAPNNDTEQPTDLYTREQLDTLCKSILGTIIKDGMTDREKAQAIYNRVNSIKYVATEESQSWITAAYTGLTTGKGDCVNYSAASKALLTAAGIPNYDMQRIGGTSDHYWQIVYIDGGWYHFDACPTSRNYPLKCFLLTDDEVAEYSASRTDIPNYYNYDRENCPYEVVKTRDS